jgi:hypothetical protein
MWGRQDCADGHFCRSIDWGAAIDGHAFDCGGLSACQSCAFAQSDMCLGDRQMARERAKLALKNTQNIRGAVSAA